MALLLDTSPLYALADKSESEHKNVKSFFEEQKEVMIVPWVILPELAYMLHTRLGVKAEQAFLHSLNENELGVEGLHDRDLKRSEEILVDYPQFGFVDSIV